MLTILQAVILVFAVFFTAAYGNSNQDIIQELTNDLGTGKDRAKNNGKVQKCKQGSTKKITIKESKKEIFYEGIYKNCVEYGKVRNDRIVMSKFKDGVNIDLFSDSDKYKYNGLSANEWSNRAYIAEQSGDYAKAVEAYTNVLRLEPDSGMAYFWRGDAYDKLHELSKANKDMVKALELKREVVSAILNENTRYKNLMKVYFSFHKYQRAIEQNPNDAEAYNGQGNAYLIIGNVGHGCSDLKKACDLGMCTGYTNAIAKGICGSANP